VARYGRHGCMKLANMGLVRPRPNNVTSPSGGRPVRRYRIALVRLQTLVLMGAICCLLGAMYVGIRGAIDLNEGADFALIVIAAVIIGGTPLSGGWGTVIGAVTGMLIIQVISSGIFFFGIAATWSTFVTGAVIVLDQAVKVQRTRRAAHLAKRP